VTAAHSSIGSKLKLEPAAETNPKMASEGEERPYKRSRLFG
jgi:hypothetical protein